MLKKGGKKKKAVSKVITSVLIMVVSLFAFLIVYNVVIGITQEKAGSIETGTENFIEELFSIGEESSDDLSNDEGINGDGQGETPIDGIDLGEGLTGQVVYNSESCYIELEIKEKKINDRIEFSLLDMENLYGTYANLVNECGNESQGHYMLSTYDENRTNLHNYSVNSGRFLFYDTFNQTNPGGIIETNQSIISIIIPYDHRIKDIKIKYNDIETELAFNSNDMRCERTCIIENETGIIGEDECCAGLIKVDKDEENFVCVNCGDGVCSENEDYYSCFEDCPREFECEEEYVKTEYGCELKKGNIDSCTVINETGEYKLIGDIWSKDGADVDGYHTGYCIIIEASDISLDCNGHLIEVESGSGGIYSTKAGTEIRNCEISVGNGYGIYLNGANYSTIESNELVGDLGSINQSHGLYVENIYGVSIYNNYIGYNSFDGIRIYNNEYATLRSNTINYNGGEGIYIQNSNVDLYENYIKYNKRHGVYVDGSDVGFSYNEVCNNEEVDVKCVDATSPTNKHVYGFMEGSHNIICTAQHCPTNYPGWPEDAGCKEDANCNFNPTRPYCIEGECVECGSGKPQTDYCYEQHCFDGECVECIEDINCPQNYVTTEKDGPYCVENECVECKEDWHCSGEEHYNTPYCVNNKCISQK